MDDPPEVSPISVAVRAVISPLISELWTNESPQTNQQSANEQNANAFDRINERRHALSPLQLTPNTFDEALSVPPAFLPQQSSPLTFPLPHTEATSAPTESSLSTASEHTSPWSSVPVSPQHAIEPSSSTIRSPRHASSSSSTSSQSSTPSPRPQQVSLVKSSGLVHSTSASSSSTSTKELRVSRACQSCKLSKTKCDNARPCGRCVKSDRASTCVDGIHFRRGMKRSINDVIGHVTTAAIVDSNTYAKHATEIIASVTRDSAITPRHMVDSSRVEPQSAVPANAFVSVLGPTSSWNASHTPPNSTPVLMSTWPTTYMITDMSASQGQLKPSQVMMMQYNPLNPPNYQNPQAPLTPLITQQQQMQHNTQQMSLTQTPNRDLRILSPLTQINTQLPSQSQSAAQLQSAQLDQSMNVSTSSSSSQSSYADFVFSPLTSMPVYHTLMLSPADQFRQNDQLRHSPFNISVTGDTRRPSLTDTIRMTDPNVRRSSFTELFRMQVNNDGDRRLSLSDMMRSQSPFLSVDLNSELYGIPSELHHVKRHSLTTQDLLQLPFQHNHAQQAQTTLSMTHLQPNSQALFNTNQTMSTSLPVLPTVHSLSPSPLSTLSAAAAAAIDDAIFTTQQQST